jgi:hypothetical protein
MKRTAIFSGGYVDRLPMSFSPQRWANIRSAVPELPEAMDTELRNTIAIVCSGYLTGRARLSMGQANAAALRRGSARALSEFERFAKALREAANAWKSLQGVHDDQLSDIGRFNELAGMATDAERRLEGLRALGDATAVPAAGSPWRNLVGALFKACRKAGLRPTVTNRLYDDKCAKPSWFQEFVLAVNDNLLGEQGYSKQSIAAFHAATVVAVRAVK